jgi:chemotaxis protein methyltransferase CheR
MENSGHHLLPALSELLSRQIGLHFPQERWPDLMRGLNGVARDLKCKDTQACMLQLLSSPLSRPQIEVLARHLAIGETYFFREPQVFEALQEHALPALIHKRRQTDRRLRLWSAGCSTGEEAYSLAIMLQRAIPDFREWNITILATDINPQALEKAAAGVYGEWSFRNGPAWLRERYFKSVGKGLYEIVPDVRDMVTFAYLNLAEDAFPSPSSKTSAMDIVFCRNVLMYFEPALAASVVSKHHQALVEDGWLIVSPSEVSQASFERFQPVYLTGAILHQKCKAARQAIEAAPLIKPAAMADLKRNTVKQTATVKAPLSRPALTPITDAEYQHVLALFRQSRYTEAADATRQLLDTRQRDARTMVLMGRIHANLGELAASLPWCEQAVAADRLNAASHYLLGTILQELGRGPEAVPAYKRALYLEPDFVLGEFALAMLYRDQHRTHEAARHFANALLILDGHAEDDVLPESDGMTAGRLKEIIRGNMRKEGLAA